MYRSTLLAMLALAAAYAPPAQAATDIVVNNDQAKMVSITGDPGTIVVGNPNIADVTLKGSNIFVHGRNYGSTNIIILDKDGHQMANLDVTVMLGGGHNINVFKAANKLSYACAPLCESTLQVGDVPGYFKDVVAEQNKTKGGLAEGESGSKPGQ
jgi:Pilus formation protein N terminal region